MPRWLRARTRYLTLAVGTTILGLAVHGRGGALSPVVRDVLGDALWAAMVAWGIAAVAPAFRLRWRAAAALIFCFVVEFSQLVHLPALDAQEIAGLLVDGISGAKLVTIPRAGHMVNLDAREPFDKAVESFLTGG